MMPYYGDYYAGDPGLFSGIGKIFKGALGIASKVLPGPVGMVAGVASRLVGSRPTAVGAPAPMGATVLRAVRGAVRRRRKRKLKFGSAAWRRKYGRR